MKYSIRYMEIDLTNRCNLNCASCSHFSPLAKHNIMDYDLETFTKDLERLSQLFEITILRILGGEPFLVPNILDYCITARRIFPFANISIASNGVKKELIESLLPELKKLKINVKVSSYPVVKNGYLNQYDKFNKKVENFRKLNLNTEPLYNALEKRVYCSAHECLSLYKGVLYYCAPMKNLETLEKAFNLNFNLKREDRGVDIYTHSAEEILLKWRSMDTWDKLCSHCNYSKDDCTWSLSKGLKQEWVENE